MLFCYLLWFQDNKKIDNKNTNLFKVLGDESDED